MISMRQELVLQVAMLHLTHSLFLTLPTFEVFQVLKDVATTAIYGTRGANGVIMITTKGWKR